MMCSLPLTRTDVAQEVIDALVATKKHDIVIFTRRVGLPQSNRDVQS
jgi:hypothetical protein